MTSGQLVALVAPIVFVLAVAVLILVVNARRRRGQQYGTTSRHIAPPTTLVAGAGIFSTVRNIGVVVAVCTIVVLVQHGSSMFLWSAFAFGSVAAVVGFIGRRRVYRGIRADRDRFGPSGR